MVLTTLKGMIIGAGLIIPIGAQNAYVLSQAIKRNYHFTAAFICIVCDFLLMGLGVFGGGALISANDILYYAITGAGVVFLSVYGAMFFKSFLSANAEQMKKEGGIRSRKAVIFTTLAVTLLNPHVYLDTVVIIGSISGEYQGDEKYAFWLGTALASLLWFYSLSLLAAKMSPWLSTPKVQRGINLVVALIMWLIALSLITSLLNY